MATFKNVFEGIRSPDRAVALVSRLQKMNKMKMPDIDTDRHDVTDQSHIPQIKPLTPVSDRPKVSSREEYIKDINIKDIHTDQESISPNVVKRKIMAGDDSLPYVYHHQGKYHVDDGNHRIAMARALGHKTIKARVYDREPEKK